MALFAVFWFAVCTYVAFMVTTMLDHGWTDSAATGAITAMSVLTLFVQPALGYICDKYLSEKKLAVILLLLSAVFFLLLPFSLRTGSKPLVFMNMVGITVTGMQVAGLIDAWVVGLKQEHQSINYGIIRGSGSFAFAVAAQIMGTVSVVHGHDMRLWFGCGAFLLSAFLALTFRSTNREHRTDGKDKQTRHLGGIEAFKLVFSSKQYNLLLIVSFLLLMSTSAMITLVQLLVRDFGGNASHIGTATAVAAGSEVPFMFLMAYFLKKIGFKKLLFFCGAVYVIRMFITAAIITVDALIYIQALQGLTYAVLLPISMSYLSQILDERIRSTAVTIYTAVTASLVTILVNLVITTLLATGFTARAALLVFAFSALFGFSLTLYGMVRKIW
jgi:PPP family 3-phenylpropionic acid transporter